MTEPSGDASARRDSDDANETQRPGVTGFLYLDRRLALPGGRYFRVALFGLLFATLGGWAGYMCWRPRYQSAGVLEVVPLNLPQYYPHLYVPKLMSMLQSYRRSQMACIRSRPVIAAAVQSPEWKTLGHGQSPEAIRQFCNHLRGNCRGI